MDAGAMPEPVFPLSGPSLGRLMPMHLCLSPAGAILGSGPTLRMLWARSGPEHGLQGIMGCDFFEHFRIRRPAGIEDMAALARQAGTRLSLGLRSMPGTGLRGVALPLEGAGGMIINLSFGFGLTEAVREHRLTDGDFAPTDLAVEMLFLVEAKTAVQAELRSLNQRLKGAKDAAEREALTDTLTGLGNRRAMDNEFEALLARRQPFGLIHLDLDHFKAVNDTHGHAAGDHVLRHAARLLLRETRAGDVVARIGGDEFVILTPGVAEPAVLEGVAARILRHLARPVEYQGICCAVSASIGLTVSGYYDVPDIGRMLADADRALYASKRAGRGRRTSFHTICDTPGERPEGPPTGRSTPG